MTPKNGRFQGGFVSTEHFTARLERQRRAILDKRQPDESDETIARRLNEGEQELLISEKLGDDLPREKREALMAAYHRMQEKCNAAVLALVQQRISADEYAERLQAALDELAVEHSRVLTPEEYQRLWGEKPGEPVALALDPGVIEAR